jgi:hypothetical protein
MALFGTYDPELASQAADLGVRVVPMTASTPAPEPDYRTFIEKTLLMWPTTVGSIATLVKGLTTALELCKQAGHDQLSPFRFVDFPFQLVDELERALRSAVEAAVAYLRSAYDDSDDDDDYQMGNFRDGWLAAADALERGDHLPKET